MSDTIFMGACSCGQVTYCLRDTALIVHACHCRMCQRLSGSTNAVNALIEAGKVDHLSGDLSQIEAPTPTGHGQLITRCAACQAAVWSEYRAMSALCKTRILFIRAGTLDQPEAFAPDVNIYAADMVPHYAHDGEAPIFEAFYDLNAVWPRASLERLSAARAQGRAEPVPPATRQQNPISATISTKPPHALQASPRDLRHQSEHQSHSERTSS